MFISIGNKLIYLAIFVFLTIDIFLVVSFLYYKSLYNLQKEYCDTMIKIHKDCIKDIIELYENKIINMEIIYKKHIQEMENG